MPEEYRIPNPQWKATAPCALILVSSLVLRISASDLPMPRILSETAELSAYQTLSHMRQSLV